MCIQTATQIANQGGQSGRLKAEAYAVMARAEQLMGDLRDAYLAERKKATAVRIQAVEDKARQYLYEEGYWKVRHVDMANPYLAISTWRSFWEERVLPSV